MTSIDPRALLTISSRYVKLHDNESIFYLFSRCNSFGRFRVQSFIYFQRSLNIIDKCGIKIMEVTR